MDNVLAAALLPERIVPGSCIQNQRVLPFEGRRKGEDRIRGGIGNDKSGPGRRLFLDAQDKLIRRSLDDLERELLLQEPPGRIVVRDGELCPGDALVLRRKIEQGQRQRLLHLLPYQEDGDPLQLLGTGRARIGLWLGLAESSAGESDGRCKNRQG